MIETQARTRDISVTFPRHDVQIFVDGDRTRLKQVLINLLSNAVKYNKVGGSVAVDCVLSTPGRVRIRVTDTGEGLCPNKLSQLFQPFNRLGKETGIDEGTGIGLMLSKRLIELMTGEIGVQSTVGVGSEFWIELNRSLPQQQTATSTPSASRSGAAASANGRVRTVLYVEDNPANLMLVEEIVARRADMHLISAVDGNRGVQLACASLPDVILMDINLPGISGVQALKLLHANPATAHIPVIALSANAMPRDIERGLAIGFFRYLTKPIKVKELMDTLDAAVTATGPATVQATEEHRA
jgi:CheY-like chemotaxis protein